jgi:hypothetical protein
MLRLQSSLTRSYGGLRERECPRCHREVDLPLGQMCPRCLGEANLHAQRVARWVSLTTTLAFGVYTVIRLPEDPTARMVGGVSIVMWYVITRLITLRVARTWFLR